MTVAVFAAVVAIVAVIPITVVVVVVSAVAMVAIRMMVMVMTTTRRKGHRTDQQGQRCFDHGEQLRLAVHQQGSPHKTGECLNR
jgi:hypothetical protein